MVIWKYKLELTSAPLTHKIPGFVKVVGYGLDSNNDVCVWCMVDKDKKYEDVTFWCWGTDWDMPESLINSVPIGSVNQFGYMCHIFLMR